MKIKKSIITFPFVLMVTANSFAVQAGGVSNGVTTTTADGEGSSAKITNVLGSGDGYASLTVSWGDNLAIDNLVSEVRFTGDATVSELRLTALEKDSRFYALQDGDGNLVAFGFDTNGDHSAGILADGTALTMNGGVAATSDYAGAVASSNFDHWNVNSAEKCWKVFVNGNYVDDFGTTVAAGDKIALQYLPVAQNDMSTCPYTFNLRPDDQQGLWILENIVINTADGKKKAVPALANIGDDKANLYGSKFATEVYMPDGVTTTSNYSASFTWGNIDNMSCNVTVSVPADALIRPYLNIRKDWGDGKQTVKRVYGDVDSKVSTIVAHPLTGIGLKDVEKGGTIEVDNMGVAIITPVYEPENADFTGYTTSFDNEDVATFYKSVNAIVAHSEGQTTLTIASPDGAVSATYNVKVKGVDPENRPESFLNGMVWLNEEWFTHTSGSLNFIDADGKIYYRAYGNQNGNMAFGATSQFGMNYAGKYVIMSKQAWDAGDTRPLRSGGRVVVFDAETFKHIGSIDDIGGDGRSCVGVTPSKIYLGTAKGIRVMNLDDITVSPADIAGMEVSRNGQIGDMVKAGRYVFATNIGTGVSVIDTTNDSFVKTIPSTGVQGLVQSADGRVWIGCAKTLTPIDPETLEVGPTYNIPGTITCSTYSWRSVNLLASHKTNTLFWGSGTFYRWDLDEVEDPSTLTPVYTHKAKDGDINYGNGYGSPGYDSETDTYMFATEPGFGALALQNWYHFIDGTTGAVKHRVHLPEYWWFPAMPIKNDIHAPEISLESMACEADDDPFVYDLNEYVTDKDNHDCNINITLGDDAEAYSEPVADVVLDGKTLTVTPKNKGTRMFTLVAESNGRVTSKNISVNVGMTDGVTDVDADDAVEFEMFSTSGIKVGSFTGVDNVKHLNLPSGVYVIRGNNGKVSKIVVK